MQLWVVKNLCRNIMKFESSEKHVSGIFGELKAEVQSDMDIPNFNRKRYWAETAGSGGSAAARLNCCRARATRHAGPAAGLCEPRNR
jgi:hypothetical protein